MLNGNYSGAEYPLIIDGVYFFGSSLGEYISLTGQAVNAETVEKYVRCVEALRSGGAAASGYLVKVSDSGVTVEYEGESKFISKETVFAVPEVKAAFSAREEGLERKIGAVISCGEIFITVKGEPDIFVGLRTVNDGVPPIALKYDFSLETLKFSGMADFTWYGVHSVTAVESK